MADMEKVRVDLLKASALDWETFRDDCKGSLELIGNIKFKEKAVTKFEIDFQAQ